LSNISIQGREVFAPLSFEKLLLNYLLVKVAFET